MYVSVYIETILINWTYLCIQMTHFSMKTSILSLSLLHIVTCTVYNVIPDDHNTTCHHCHTLQYYQLNINKYFTSNIQLLFLPGLHHLHTDLIIQNVHNISLIGSTANGTTLNTVMIIQYAELELNDITNLTIKNLMIQRNVSLFNNSNTFLYSSLESSVIIIRDCINVLINYLQIHIINDGPFGFTSLVLVNVLGKSQLSHILCHNIQIDYTETEIESEDSSLLIDHYQTQNKYLLAAFHNIILSTKQISYRVTLQISNTTVAYYINSFINIECNSNAGAFKLIIVHCQFKFNYFGLFSINGNERNGIIYFKNCQFLSDNTYGNNIYIHGITIHITDCVFYNSMLSVHQSPFINDTAIVNITNTVFSNANINCSLHEIDYVLISLTNTAVIFSGTVIFTNITCRDTIISLADYSTITINGLVKFSNNHVNKLINFINNHYQFIIMKEPAALAIAKNKICTFFSTVAFKPIPYPLCFFQYDDNEGNDGTVMYRNFSITFHYNKYETTNPYTTVPTPNPNPFPNPYPSLNPYPNSDSSPCANPYSNPNPSCVTKIPITNCQWLPQSSFKDVIPLDVNKRYIQYYDNNNFRTETFSINQSTLCICSDDMNYDCHISDLGYLYPGQILTIFLHSTTKQHNNFNPEVVVVKTDINYNLPYVKPCTVLNINEHQQFINKSCTELRYTIAFSSKWCEIYLKILYDYDSNINIFNIRKLKCPPGFTEINKICQCDTVITNFVAISCNINDQTISRPANSWISATTHNNSYTYQISLHCPFHYCLPHSSHLNFFTPNSQCQFNRYGLLCGQCQQGHSSVFGSPYCQECSNIYILLIIPIAISGLLLVFLIFHLNLTVTDGNINAFILYTNIISINIPVFFPSTNEIMPAHTFISLTNLDLGFQTCFYNGMSDYAKTWLQLSFPFYLIFIATLLIISSRHYTTIQRLTARRALPVLATLFLLSYTKILQTISGVLFFYSSITYLPSKHTRLVWSVDSNVPLFGVQYAMLFIVCLILFLILLTFNIILLFTRTLSRFRFINKFKPLLDAYQGPYRDKFYYWTGLQLLLRAVLFGLSSLDRNINLTVGIILLDIFGGVTGVVRPFKDNVKNYQQLLLIFNLHGLYTISLYMQDDTNQNFVIAMITTSAVQLMFIFTYHTITYGCGGVIRNKIHLCINSLTRCISRLQKRLQKRLQHQHFQLQDITRDNIPEVAFNYREFREPIVGYN